MFAGMCVCASLSVCATYKTKQKNHKTIKKTKGLLNFNIEGTP